MMTFSVTYWDTWDDSFTVGLVCKGGRILLSILMTCVIYLHSSMQEEHSLQNINAKCHLRTRGIHLYNIIIHLVAW